MKIQSLSTLNSIQTKTNNHISNSVNANKNAVELNLKNEISFGGLLLEKFKLKSEAKKLRKESQVVENAAEITLKRIKDHSHKAQNSVQKSKKILKEAEILKADLRDMFYEISISNPSYGVIEYVGEVERRLSCEDFGTVIKETKDGKLIRKTVVDDDYISVVTTAPHRKHSFHVLDKKTLDLLNYSEGFEKLENGGYKADDRFVFVDEKLIQHQFDYKFEFDEKAGKEKETSRRIYAFKKDSLSEHFKMFRQWEDGVCKIGERTIIQPLRILQTVNETHCNDGSYHSSESYLFKKHSEYSARPKLTTHKKNVHIGKNNYGTIDRIINYDNGNLSTIMVNVRKKPIGKEFEKKFEYSGKKQKPHGCVKYEPLNDFNNSVVERYIKF